MMTENKFIILRYLTHVGGPEYFDTIVENLEKLKYLQNYI